MFQEQPTASRIPPCAAPASIRFVDDDILRPLPRWALEVVLEFMSSGSVPRLQLLPSNIMKVSSNLRILVLALLAYPQRNPITALRGQYLVVTICG